MTTELELEKQCPGYWDYNLRAYLDCGLEQYPRVKCPTCHNSGKVPSEEGEELLDFLRKYYK